MTYIYINFDTMWAWFIWIQGRPVCKLRELLGWPFCQIAVICYINIVSCSYVFGFGNEICLN